MRYISATEAKQNFAAALDAAQREGPWSFAARLAIWPCLISFRKEYDRLRGIGGRRAFEAFCDRVGAKAAAQGLTERKLAALLKADA